MKVRIHSDKEIFSPRGYLNSVFGAYWQDAELSNVNSRVITCEVTEACRRVCELSRNIDILYTPSSGNRWDESPLVCDEEIPF